MAGFKPAASSSRPGVHPFDRADQRGLRSSAPVAGPGSPRLAALDGGWPLPFRSQYRTLRPCLWPGPDGREPNRLAAA